MPRNFLNLGGSKVGLKQVYDPIVKGKIWVFKTKRRKKEVGEKCGRCGVPKSKVGRFWNASFNMCSSCFDESCR
jgi:hypothetical protein